MAALCPSFDHYGAGIPVSPVILSVPHAGRDYPLSLRAALRVPVAALTVLEDRHVDAVALAARALGNGGEAMLVQRRARAWIDLNRSEYERDPAIDEGAAWTALAAVSAKVRGGLGLIPRRIAGAGELWRRRIDAQDVAMRIRDDYRPYHAVLSSTLAAAKARFGTAILLDIHSMPTLGPDKPRIVIGDRFGRSANGRFVAAVEAVAVAAGYTAGLNAPYAGGHILEAHARPTAGVHGVQIEFDRSLYLDPAGDLPGDGLAGVAATLRAIIDTLADEAMARLPVAAE